MWLEIENLTGDQRHLSPPPILAPPFHFPLSRWYPEGSAGEPWDGTLGARQKIRVNAIGYVSEVVQPGTMIHAQFSLGSVAVQIETSALATIHLAARDRSPVDGALLREE